MSDETVHEFTAEHPTPLDTAPVGNAAVNGPIVDPAYADVMSDGTAVANQGKGAVELVPGAVVTNVGAVPASITTAPIDPIATQDAQNDSTKGTDKSKADFVSPEPEKPASKK
jgi:hypothetical protein